MQVFCQYVVSYFFIEIGKFLRLLEKGLLTKENLDKLDEFKKDPNNNEDDVSRTTQQHGITVESTEIGLSEVATRRKRSSGSDSTEKFILRRKK